VSDEAVRQGAGEGLESLADFRPIGLRPLGHGMKFCVVVMHLVHDSLPLRYRFALRSIHGPRMQSAGRQHLITKSYDERPVFGKPFIDLRFTLR
jgi:hypothetical protein